MHCICTPYGTQTLHVAGNRNVAAFAVIVATNSWTSKAARDIDDAAVNNDVAAGKISVKRTAADAGTVVSALSRQ